MANWRDVVSLNEAHPDWTVGMVATELDCDEAYIRATGKRKKLTFARARYGFSTDLAYIRDEIRRSVADLDHLDRAVVTGESINQVRRRIGELKGLLSEAASKRRRSDG